MAKVRNYRKEYDNYQGTEVQKEHRASRNKARRMMEAEGKAHKGDGLDVDHANSNPMHDVYSNLRMKTKHANRSYKRDKNAHEL